MKLWWTRDNGDDSFRQLDGRRVSRAASLTTIHTIRLRGYEDGIKCDETRPVARRFLSECWSMVMQIRFRIFVLVVADGRLGLYFKAKRRDWPIGFADWFESAFHDDGAGIESEADRLVLDKTTNRIVLDERSPELNGRIDLWRLLLLQELVGRFLKIIFVFFPRLWWRLLRLGRSLDGKLPSRRRRIPLVERLLLLAKRTGLVE